jgi:hypothetical protein
MSKVKSGLKSLFKIAENAAKGVDQSVPAQVAESRQNICNGCPKRIDLLNQCKECGCFLAAKTKIKQEKCPLDKWGEYKSTTI